MKIILAICLFFVFLYGDKKQDEYVAKILTSSDVHVNFKGLNNGKILYIARKDQEQTPSSIALSMALYVKAPYKDVLKDIEISQNRLSGYKHSFCIKIDDTTNMEPFFEKAVLLDDEADEIEKLANYKNGNEFNLSKNEIKKLKAMQNDRYKLSKVFFKELLIKRTKKYMKNGINGIEAYEHCDDGDSVEDGFKASSIGMKIFKRDFPHLYNYYVNYPKVQPTKQMSEAYFVIKDKVDDRVAFMLKHQIIEQKPYITLIAEREFYISNSLDGIQTQIICAPYKDGTLVALSSQSYTDKVSGFARGIAVGIGRSIMKKQILPIFEFLKNKYN